MNRRALALMVLLATALAGCGGESGTARGERPPLVVSAASSLKPAFEAYARDFDAARPAYAFAGSDELAAQIRAGAHPDVFAAANTKLPDALHAAGLVSAPVPFATNRLVIAVPSGTTRVRSVEDLARPGTKVVIGSKDVPIGDYTRKVLGGLPPDTELAVLDNVRSEEPDVASIAAKVGSGGADAGLVYATDVKASGGRLRAVALPDRLQPVVVYAAAMVKGARRPEAANAFVDGLRSGAGARALRVAGFGPPPA
jgi:molybdate transport system substrate-binding protein